MSSPNLKFSWNLFQNKISHPKLTLIIFFFVIRLSWPSPFLYTCVFSFYAYGHAYSKATRVFSSQCTTIDSVSIATLNSIKVLVPCRTVPSPTKPQPRPPTWTHSMVTQSLNNIFKPKQLNLTTKHPLPNFLDMCVKSHLWS